MSSALPFSQLATRSLYRERLVERVRSSPSHAVLMLAPSGYGKSILAAQVASGFDRVVWLHCEGSAPDWARLCGMLGQEDEEDSAGADGPTCLARVADAITPDLCLVLDDVGLDTSGDSLDDLWIASQVLGQAGARLVATTREERTQSSALHRFTLIGVEDLRFTKSEAVDLSGHLGVRLASTWSVDDIWDATNGHAAFLGILLQSAGDTGRDQVADLRLSSWLAHAVSLLPSETNRLLQAASLLRRGRTVEAVKLAGNTSLDLSDLARRIPLLRLHTVGGVSGFETFEVHDLLADFVVKAMRAGAGADAQMMAREAVDRLLDTGSLNRATHIVDLAGSEYVRHFLAMHGAASLGYATSSKVADLLESLDLSEVLADASLMLLWSEALRDCERIEEALSKAKATRVVASHAGRDDIGARAFAVTLDCLRVLNRWDEAGSGLVVARELLSATNLEPLPRMALLRASASVLASLADYELAGDMLREIVGMTVEGDAVAESDRRDSAEILALLPCFEYGDYMATARQISPWAALEEGSRAQKVDSRGNLAAALLESGRVDRARALLAECLDLAGSYGLISFLPVLGSVCMAEGQELEGLNSMARGISTAVENRAESEAAQNRVYQAMLLRAAGHFEDSLTAAERAYERLCLQDFMDFRRLAALEVAASLLALGDPAAARAWAEPVIAAGFGKNEHHAFRAAMITAECARREGDVQAAVNELAGHAEHVRSENSNFQLAMYSRAFPHVLGVVTATLGAEALPVHLLRMITPEAAERCLRAAQPLLDSSQWASLGVKLLGAEQFAAFVERKGRPLCRVRFFGGLEITVGDRAIAERDWKKRKARQLFTMLAMKRGQEVPRDQLLEHIWPDLSDEKAKNNFYVAWSTMKSTLMGDGNSGPCPYVDNAAGRCRILRDSVRSDLDEFEELVAAARNCESLGDPLGAIDSYERLASVYHGDLLPSDLYDDWFTPVRERYRFEFIAAMTRVVELLLERDNPCEALVFARRALHVDPYREDLYQSALRCHIAAGQRSAAIETFVQCKTQLAEELGLDPSAETVALYQEVLVMEERPRYDDFGLSSGR